MMVLSFIFVTLHEAVASKKSWGSSTIFSTASRGLKIASFTIITFDG